MLHLLKSQADSEQIKRLVSPVFFRLFSPTVVAKQVGRLLGGYFGGGALTEAMDGLAPDLESAFPSLRLRPKGKRKVRRRTVDSSDAPLMGDGAREVGSLTLALYFWQFFSQRSVFLDLSFDTFDAPEPHEDGPSIIWAPRPVIYRWHEDFRMPLLDLYFGYYRDEPDRFRVGLSRLGLLPEGDLLRHHFGPHKGTMKFSTEHFRATFGKVFDSCAERGARLHPDFIALGVYLGTLYEHLEHYDEAFDVRDCFSNVAGRPHAAGPSA